MMIIDNVFELGQILYLKTDKEQQPAILTGIHILPIGLVYRISMGLEESIHYECELSPIENVALKINNQCKPPHPIKEYVYEP